MQVDFSIALAASNLAQIERKTIPEYKSLPEYQKSLYEPNILLRSILKSRLLVSGHSPL